MRIWPDSDDDAEATELLTLVIRVPRVDDDERTLALVVLTSVPRVDDELWIWPDSDDEALLIDESIDDVAEATTLLVLLLTAV